jgi:16S rRNA (guanine527-N7)-methyltransferase
VVVGRAEDIARQPAYRQAFGVVTARSFGPPAVTAECGAPFLVEGGLLVVAEPPAEDPTRWPASGLARLGLAVGDRIHADGGTVQVLRAVAGVDERYPRRVGVPAKRPLF